MNTPRRGIAPSKTAPQGRMSRPMLALLLWIADHSPAGWIFAYCGRS